MLSRKIIEKWASEFTLRLYYRYSSKGFYFFCLRRSTAERRSNALVLVLPVVPGTEVQFSVTLNGPPEVRHVHVHKWEIPYLLRMKRARTYSSILNQFIQYIYEFLCI